jgi:hypothetical protein
MRNRTTRLIIKMLLVVGLLSGVVALTGSTAQAQRWQRIDRYRGGAHGRVFIYPRRWYWDRWYWYDPIYPFGYQSYYYSNNHVTEGQGYRDGLDDGKDDAKDGKPNNPYRHKDYKNAITSAYIDGYLRGYTEGFRQLAR